MRVCKAKDWLNRQGVSAQFAPTDSSRAAAMPAVNLRQVGLLVRCGSFGHGFAAVDLVVDCRAAGAKAQSDSRAFVLGSQQRLDQYPVRVMRVHLGGTLYVVERLN